MPDLNLPRSSNQFRTNVSVLYNAVYCIETFRNITCFPYNIGLFCPYSQFHWYGIRRVDARYRRNQNVCVALCCNTGFQSSNIVGPKIVLPRIKQRNFCIRVRSTSTEPNLTLIIKNYGRHFKWR